MERPTGYWEKPTRYWLERTGRWPLRIEGERLGEWETSTRVGAPNWSGSLHKWEKVSLYRTVEGKLVLHVVRYSVCAWEKDQYQALAFGSPREVVEYAEEHLPKLARELADSLLQKERGSTTPDLSPRL